MNKSQMGEIADKVLRKRFFVIIPFLLFALVGWLWLRPTSITPLAKHGNTFEYTGDVVDVGARPDWCEDLQKSDGYLLFSGNIELRNTEEIQGFFQTDEEEIGIFYDFDNGPRLGIALSDGNTSRIQSGIRFDSKKLSFLILIRQDQSITYFENSKRTEFNIGQINPLCNSVKIGVGNESPPFTGQILLSVSSGTDGSVASKLVEKYDSQFHTTKVRLFGRSKNALIIALIFLTLGNPFKKRGLLKPTAESESI